jgi:hypothetical protein
MIINFFSITGNLERNNNTIKIVGYSEYFNKYFELTIKRCNDRNYVIDARSDESNIIVKSQRNFYSIETMFFHHLIEPPVCLNFNYKKYNIPVNVFITMMGLISVTL